MSKNHYNGRMQTTLRINPELYKKVQIKLIVMDMTFCDWVVEQCEKLVKRGGNDTKRSDSKTKDSTGEAGA